LILSLNSTFNWYKWYNPTTTGLPAIFKVVQKTSLVPLQKPLKPAPALNLYHCTTLKVPRRGPRVFPAIQMKKKEKSSYEHSA